MLAIGQAHAHHEREAPTTVSDHCRDVQLIVTRCEPPCPWNPVQNRRGLGGYANAKLRFRGLRLRGRARGSQPCLNMMELYPNSLQVMLGPYLKNLKKKGFGRIPGS